MTTYSQPQNFSTDVLPDFFYSVTNVPDIEFYDDWHRHMRQIIKKNSPDRGLGSSPDLDPDLG